MDRPKFFASFDKGHAVQYFYEPFLEAFDPALRKELNVWYTPDEIVRYKVERVAEKRSLSEAYRTAKRAPAPQGQGLNDLYVRFFRMAERRIAELNQPAEGVVCFIYNYSWLDGLSFTGMRERYLDTETPVPGVTSGRSGPGSCRASGGAEAGPPSATVCSPVADPGTTSTSTNIAAGATSRLRCGST